MPTVTLANFNNTCVNSIPFNLTGGYPAGGSYSGTGVNGGVFDPEIADLGPHTIIYTYTDGNSCSNSASNAITVNPLPNVDISGLASYYCLNDLPVVVTGMPGGGTLSGTGVTGNTFNPSLAGIGNHTVIYAYADNNGCIGTDTVFVEVNVCTGIFKNDSKNSMRILPNPNTGNFWLSFNITGIQDVVINVLSYTGQLVYTEKHLKFSGEFVKDLDLRFLSEGIYLVNIQAGSNSSTERMSILK